MEHSIKRLPLHLPILIWQPISSEFWSPANSVALIYKAIQLLSKYIDDSTSVSIYLDAPHLLDENTLSELRYRSSQAEILILSGEIHDLDLRQFLLCFPFDPAGCIPNLLDLKILNYFYLTLLIDDFFCRFISDSEDLTRQGLQLAVAELLEDTESRRIFYSLLQVRESIMVSQIPFSPYPQYLHPSVVSHLQSLQQPKTFVDCGSTNGAEMQMLVRVNPAAFSEVVAFDPNGSIMMDSCCDIPVRLVQKAVMLKTGTYFIDGHSIGARVSMVKKKDTDIQISAVNIDDYVNMQKITDLSLIRMDIEGSEFDALIGAKHCISTFRPALIICLYHHPGDLFRLPLLVASIDQSYKFYIGHHNPSCFYETVMYCIPS
jgi:FkbM family methyltransferase